MIARIQTVALLVWALCIATLPLFAAANTPTWGATTPGPGSPSHPAQVALLGPGDGLMLQVYGQPDMNTTVYVGEDGTIPIPLVGPVAVAGMTPTDAARVVEKSLLNNRILVNPAVTLSVVQRHSNRVSVLGEVAAPGRYAIDRRTTLFDLLAEAGGIKETGGDTVYVLRTDATGASRRIAISVSAALGNSSGASAHLLQPGDVINVPRAAQISIKGAVRAPGTYRLDPDTTVLQAISKAGGPNERGSDRRMVIQRLSANGVYEVRSAKPSDPVQADDIITVKERIF